MDCSLILINKVERVDNNLLDYYNPDKKFLENIGINDYLITLEEYLMK